MKIIQMSSTKSVLSIILFTLPFFSLYSAQEIVKTMPLGESQISGTVRLVVRLNEEAIGPDIGITLHQNLPAQPWDDALALCMFDFIKNTNGGIYLAGYNASSWEWHTEVKKVQKNRMVALWLTYDADKNTHSLSAQMQGETSVTSIYSNYGARAPQRGMPNDWVGYCSLFINNKDGQSTSAIEVIEEATFVSNIEPFDFNDSTCFTSYSDVLSLDMQQGETYSFGDRLLTSSGVYYDTLVNVQGCDSIVTLNLTVIPNSDKARILALMQKVNNYYMSQNPETTTINSGEAKWLEGSYFNGHMALFRLHPTPELMRYAMQWAENNQWNIGNTAGEADNQCVGQTYMDLYYAQGTKDDYMLEKVGTSVSDMVQRITSTGDWHWVDALYMAMPTLTRYGLWTQNDTYFDKLYEMYTDTKVGRSLYNANDSLWYRDEGALSGNKYKCYWSRGNGWAFGAHVRTLSYLPPDDAHRQEYIDTYKAMAYKLIQLQRPDGFWNSCLDDSTYYPGPETSGTSFFVYGLAWGINQGYLDKETFLPAVLKGWNALVDVAMDDNGRIGYVQGVADEPKDNQPVIFEHSREYGYGNFLLAGAELVHLVEGELPLPQYLFVKGVEYFADDSLRVDFFEPIEGASAQDVTNYTLNKDANVQSATLSADKMSCILQLGNVSKGAYGISFNGITSVLGKMIESGSGQCFFVYETEPSPICEVESKNEMITLYPNPIEEDYLSIVCGENHLVTITLRDISGKKILSHTQYSDANGCKVNVAGVLSGMYLVHVKAKDINASEFVIIR